VSSVVGHVIEVVVKGQVEEAGHQDTTVVVNNVAGEALRAGLAVEDRTQGRGRLGVPIVDGLHRADSTDLEREGRVREGGYVSELEMKES